MALFDDIPPALPRLLMPLFPFPLCCCAECEEEMWGRWLFRGGGGGRVPDTLAIIPK